MRHPFTGRYFWLRLLAKFEYHNGTGYVEFRRPASPREFRFVRRAVQKAMEVRR